MRARPLISAIPLLLLFWLLTLYAARSTSMTVDEGLHIASGYSILRTGDYRLVEEHPPLAKMWAALPLLFVPGLPDPRQFPAWDEALIQPEESLPLLMMAQKIVAAYTPVDRLVLPARAMIALLGLLLAAVVYRWAADLWGIRGGLLALLLLSLDPNILAHSAVVATDIGAAAMATLTLFLFARWLRQPRTGRLIPAGIALGLALGTKTSAILLLPIAALLGFIASPRQGKKGRAIPDLAGLLGIAALTLWALYGFEVGHLPGVPIPVPAVSHTIPWLRLQRHLADGHPAFLMGENRLYGWWYYFPVAFALKTPLPTLLLLALSAITIIASGIRQPLRWKHLIRRWGPLVLFPSIYGFGSLFSALNIGYRHLLPVLPFCFILAGRLAVLPSRFPPLRFALYFLLAWLTLGTLRIAPHYLAFFNEIAGGPDNGWRYLADSNTDWGQGYKDLARFQRERGLKRVYLSAFIPSYDPAIYGVVYEPLTPMWGTTPPVFPSRFSPPPGDYVISATTLDGIPLVDPEMYDWFRKREPDARIAHVLFYYHVPPQEPPPRWVAQCTVPVAPLPPEVIAEGFGRDNLRLAEWDCTQAWLYPEGGNSAGWYVFYRDPATETPFIRSHLALARLSYEQKRRGSTPPFRMYEWPADTALPIPSSQPEIPPGESSPIPLNGPLTFLGATAFSEKDALNVETWWQVTQGPITRPLSIMGHLLAPDGEMIGQDDGLGVPPVVWQPGDVIVQRHRFPLVSPGTEVLLRTGAYWLDTMERWPLAGTPEGDVIVLRLPE